MALLINKNETIFGDIQISQVYLRLTVSYGPEGETLIVQADPYSSKNAFQLSTFNKFYIQQMSAPYIITYDRVTNGSDILTYAHDTIKSILTTDITHDTPVLDPSTGEPTYDPSTGEPITEETVITPKYAMDSSISIVDI